MGPPKKRPPPWNIGDVHPLMPGMLLYSIRQDRPRDGPAEATLVYRGDPTGIDKPQDEWPQPLIPTRGWLTADEVRAMEDLPPLEPKTYVGAEIPDCPEPGSKLVFPAGGDVIADITADGPDIVWGDEPRCKILGYGWMSTAEVSARWPMPRSLYKLALATAAVWVAAVVTGMIP